MKERHKAERQALMTELEKKHKAEESAQKAEYRALVAEYEGHKSNINKRREGVLQRRTAVERDLKHRRDSLSLGNFLRTWIKSRQKAHAQAQKDTWRLC